MAGASYRSTESRTNQEPDSRSGSGVGSLSTTNVDGRDGAERTAGLWLASVRGEYERVTLERNKRSWLLLEPKRWSSDPDPRAGLNGW
jgi:hypothetical protein